MELFKLQLLARWSSDVIRRYVRESPLSTLTSDYLKVAQGNSLEEIISHLQASTEEAHRKLEAFDSNTQMLLEVERRSRKTALGAPPGQNLAPNVVVSYVENLKSEAVHKALVYSADVSPLLWSTVCGWKFGKALVQRRESLSCSWSQICDKCLPAVRRQAKQNAGAESE
jgi:hypothetical protein